MRGVSKSQCVDADFVTAARKGKNATVARMIAGGVSQTTCTKALMAAAKHGRADIVEMLLPVSAPKECGSSALVLAAQEGHLKCLQLLIPVSDPKTNDSMALQIAVARDHHACVDVLWSCSDPEQALAMLKKNNGAATLTLGTLRDFEQRLQAQQQQQALVDAVFSERLDDCRSTGGRKI